VLDREEQAEQRHGHQVSALKAERLLRERTRGMLLRQLWEVWRPLRPFWRPF
jgi:hypothetical protein